MIKWTNYLTWVVTRVGWVILTDNNENGIKSIQRDNNKL